MQNWKKLVGALLTLTLFTGTLAGCTGGGNSSASSEASSGVSSAAPSSEASSAVSSEASSSGTSSAAASGTSAAYSDGLTEDGFFEGVTALDYVTLPDYKNMEIPAETLKISDEDLQSSLDAMLSEYATTEQVKDRAVEDGDTVNIDYVGSVDGEEFSGGTTNGNGTTVTIGVTSYIDDFLEQLIGHKPGETIDVNVTFPEPYENNPDLSGKDALFVTTINYIEEKENPELTDDVVAEHWKESKGWSTAAQMKAGVEEQLKQAAVWGYLWEQIQKEAQVKEVPAEIAEYHLGNMKAYYTNLATQYSMELEDFLSQYVGVEDMDALVEKNQEAVDENAKSALLLQALCEDMGYTVSEEALADYMTESLGTSDLTDLEEFYGRPYLFLVTREALIKNEVSAMRLAD